MFTLKCKALHTYWDNLIGLMNRKSIEPTESVLLRSKQVHTFFMRFDIAVFHLDNQLRVIEKQILKPWRIGAYRRKSMYVLECHPTVYQKIEIGYRAKNDFQLDFF